MPKLRTPLLALALLATAACQAPEEDGTAPWTEIPGTLGAAPVAGRPFSLSPSGRYLLYLREFGGAVPLLDGPERRDLPATYRLVDLRDLTTRQPPPLRPEQLDALLAPGAVHLLTAGCWLADGDRVSVSTDEPRHLVLDAGAATLDWQVIERDALRPVPRCPLPQPPPRSPFTVGAFVVDQGSGQGLVVRVANDPTRRLLQLEAGIGEYVVTAAQAAPDGRRLALLYTRATGSFVGRQLAVLIDAGDGAVPVRQLGQGFSQLAWTPDGRGLIAFGRRDGERLWGLYRLTLE